MSQLDRATNYRIRIEGLVDSSLAEWFGPVEIRGGTHADGRAITELAGTAADQAALVGLIRHLHGLGIVLLSVERIADGDEKGANR